MYILFFLLWVLFNGQVTLEIVLFGIVIAGAVYAFCCKFLDYSPGKDWMILKKSGYILAYLGVLIWEIIKANAATLKLIVSLPNNIYIASSCYFIIELRILLSFI